MKTKLFVVDGNWYLHRVYHTINPIHREAGQALLYAFLSLVLKDACMLKASHLLIAFDGPEVFRYKLYPKYKANRSKNKSEQQIREGFKDVYEYLPSLLSCLTELRIPWIQPRKYEADDVLCSVARQYASENCFVYCGTKDKDSYQYLTQHCSLYDSSNKVKGEFRPLIIDTKTAEALKGVKVSQMVAYQCLIGDVIDNIPRVLQPAKAKKLLASYGTIKKALQTKEHEDLHARLVDLKLNQKLVTLVSTVTLPELPALRVEKVQLDETYKANLPRSYFEYIEFIHPRSKGLFKSSL